MLLDDPHFERLVLSYSEAVTEQQHRKPHEILEEAWPYSARRDADAEPALHESAMSMGPQGSGRPQG